MKKVLILGAKGMLGQELVRVFEKDKNYEVIAWDKEDIDVRQTNVLKEKITAVMPQIIFNAVAYNAVDACEEDDEEYEKAKTLNGVFPGELAKIARNIDVILVHYSTDYVFDGKRPRYKGGGKNPRCCGRGCEDCMYMGPKEKLSFFAYHENDECHPLSRYGRSKLQGEENVEKYMSHYYIIRLSKLFGAPAQTLAGKKSFFDTMYELGKKNDVVQAIDGETSKFTYAPDCAQKSKEIVDEKMEYGFYHIANEGPATWYEGVKELYKIAGIDAKIAPVSPNAFVRSAQRPSSSVLKVTKITPLRHYTEALKEYYGKK